MPKNEKYVIKQVVFNPTDPDQVLMLQHAELRTNFSAYIKRLIQRDMDGFGASLSTSVGPAPAGLAFDAEGFI